jgi:putative membrane protein
MWSNHGGWDAGQWLAMSSMMLLFWAAVIAVVVWLVRSSRAERHDPQLPVSTPVQRADEVLAERFARGEIDEDEYTRRRSVLHTADGP